jgi:predicted TIM-barrel fold metal-dependent hydrolase
MPLTDDVQIVSVDDHVIEHRNVWQDRLPAKYREAGPRNFADEQGNDVWEFEGNRKYNIGLNAVAGKKREDFGVDPTKYADMLPGCYDPAARVKDMDLEGVTAQLCFPSFPGFAGSTFFDATDKDLAAACVTAYNDWIIDEWCAANPTRQMPLCLVPFWDIEATVTEATRVAEKGAKAISFTEMPHALDLPSFHTRHWDRFFQVCEESGMPICVHFGSGGAPKVAPEAPFTTAIALFGLNSQMCTVDLLNTRIFERFPNLKFALSEGGIGWMPYVLERTDYTWERHRFYTGMAEARRPSEIFGTNIFGCFIYDDAGLDNVERIGANNIMFESDYPHSDCNWPHTRKMLAESLAHLPDDVCRRIAEDNARRVFNFPRVG